MPAYFLIQSLITVNKYDFSAHYDNLIPFIPEFIWVYHSLLPVILISMIVMVQSKKVFLTTLSAFTFASVVMFTFYVLFPSFYPRVDLPETSSISSQLVEITRMIDGANNTFPSGHVTWSFLLVFFMMTANCVKEKPWLKIVYVLWAVLIAISTVVLKQHYIIDVASGMVLAYFSYLFGTRLVSNHLGAI